MDKRSLSFDLPSDIKSIKQNLKPVYEEIMAIWPEADISRIKRVLFEAVSNAIIHGNKKDPNLNVHIEVFTMENDMWISVADQGEGFDFNQIYPSNEESIRSRGRGLIIIRKYADKIYFENKGSKIVIKVKPLKN